MAAANASKVLPILCEEHFLRGDGVVKDENCYEQDHEGHLIWGWGASWEQEDTN